MAPFLVISVHPVLALLLAVLLAALLITLLSQHLTTSARLKELHTLLRYLVALNDGSESRAYLKGRMDQAEEMSINNPARRKRTPNAKGDLT